MKRLCPLSFFTCICQHWVGRAWIIVLRVYRFGGVATYGNLGEAERSGSGASSYFLVVPWASKVACLAMNIIVTSVSGKFGRALSRRFNHVVKVGRPRCAISLARGSPEFFTPRRGRTEVSQ